MQKGDIHRAHSLTYPGKTCFRCLAGSPGAWAGGCSRLLSPFVITISTWDTVKSFTVHLALQPHPILAAVSSHKAAVLSQKRLLREQLFPATSPGAPPPGVKAARPADGCQERDVLHRMLTAPRCPGFTVTRRLLFPNVFPCGSNSPGSLASPPGQQDGPAEPAAHTAVVTAGNQTHAMPSTERVFSWDC